jgi:hypothetical protein
LRLGPVLAAFSLAACSTSLGEGPAAPRAPDPLGLRPDFSLPPVPAVEPYREPPTTLNTLDVELLRRLAAARRCESGAGESPSCKSAWSAVAEHGDHPFTALAKERLAAWSAHDDALTRRRDALAELETAYRADVAALAREPDYAVAKERADRVKAAYSPFEAELATRDLSDLPKPQPAEPPRPPSKPPLDDVLGVPDVLQQRVVIGVDAGAYTQGFELDTSDGLFENTGRARPEVDQSGFFTGGRVYVNVATESNLAIGLGVHGRVQLGTGLPTTTYETIDGSQATLGGEDGTTTGFVVGAGPRVAGNVFDRVSLVAALELGYTQILGVDAPPCGRDGAEFDPTLRGFQGDLLVGFEFYPLSLFSLGLLGRVGLGYVQGELCGAIASDEPYVPIDVSATAFGLGAQGTAGLHF